MIQLNQSPPRLFLRFFRWFCHPRMRDYIEGDLMEVYYRRVKESGKRKADRKFILDVLLLFRPGIIKSNIFQIHLFNPYMFRNYLLITYRNIQKDKAFSAINIFGLGIGMAACLLILQFVQFELSFDSFHEKLDRTYRVTNDRFQQGNLIQHGTITYPTIGPAMAKDYEEIEAFTRLMPAGLVNVRVEDRNFRGDYSTFADEHFLTVFDFEVLAGDRARMLQDPFSAVLTESTAKRYFEGSDRDYSKLLGRFFQVGLDPQPYVIQGILKDVPENSHLDFDVLVSYSTLFSGEDKSADISWQWSDMYHYLVLREGANYKDLEAEFRDFSERYFQGDKVSGSLEEFHLQPLSDAHLYSDYEYDIAQTANGKAVWAMLIVAGFILLIAWINYVNLTTSRALDRAKEVGVRKVMGARKSQLVKQFIFESLVITGLAIIAAITMVYLVQNPFNTLIGRNLSLFGLVNSLDSTLIWSCLGILAGGVLLSGFYPAFVLSAYQPVKVLKGKFGRSSGGNFLRKALVVFQFSASAALIAGTLIVSRQLAFMNQADLGMSIENTVIVQGPELMQFDSTFIDRVKNYKQELKQIQGVKNTTTSWRVAGDRLSRAFGIRLASQESDTKFTLSHMGVDYSYFDTYEIEILAGRSFQPTDHKAKFQDLTAVILNESAVKLLGIENPENAVGQELIWGEDDPKKWTIVGVVNDYHQESLHKPKEAMAFRPTYSTFSPTSIKIETVDTKEVLLAIEATYQKFFPGNSFEYSFLDQYFEAQYADDQRFGKVIHIFTGIAILVSCLGLMALASFTTSQRTKEIGVRKVLGASSSNILFNLSKDLLKPVGLAILISTPFAWYAMNNWLQQFVYRIDLNWLHFVLSWFAVGLIALVTIGVQSLKAAKVNPVKSLKME